MPRNPFPPWAPSQTPPLPKGIVRKEKDSGAWWGGWLENGLPRAPPPPSTHFSPRQAPGTTHSPSLCTISQAVALCQAMRVHTLLYSTGPYKNYTTISLVLHKLKLRQLLMHLRRTFLGAAHTPWTGDVAAELFAVLDTLQCGQISAAVMQECMTLCSTTHHLDIKSDDVWVIMRHMDKDGDGFISQAEFCRECRRIFQN